MGTQTAEARLVSLQKKGTRLTRNREQPIVCYFGQESGFIYHTVLKTERS